MSMDTSITTKYGSSKRLNAVGDLKRRVEAYWKANGHTSTIDAIWLKGDGFVRVEWVQGSPDKPDDFGPFHIPLKALYGTAEFDK